MKFLKRLVARWQSWHLKRDIDAGRVLRGRLSEHSGSLDARASTRKATISARVYRAETDAWEDLGVVYKEEG